MSKKSFSERIMAVDRSAARHIKKFMADKEEFIIVTDDERDEDDGWQDNTVGISFHNKHGFVDYAHVTRVFKNPDYANAVWLEGEAYETGMIIQQPLDYLETGDSGWIADLLK